MAGDNRQGVTVPQRPVPSVYVGSAERRGGYLYQQSARFQRIGDRHLLNLQGLVMGGDDGGTTSVHLGSSLC